mgnify:CR=1 FL=1
MVGTAAVIDRFLLAHSETECCDLTTVGWRTGRPHVVELWFGVLDGRVVMVSGNGAGGHWYRNAQADPTVVVRLAGRDLHGVARVVTDPAERRAIGELMAARMSSIDGKSLADLTMPGSQLPGNSKQIPDMFLPQCCHSDAQ